MKYLVLTAFVAVFIAGSLAALSLVGQVAVNSHSVRSELSTR